MGTTSHWAVAASMPDMDLEVQLLPAAIQHADHWHVENDGERVSMPPPPYLIAARTGAPPGAQPYRTISWFAREWEPTSIAGAPCARSMFLLGDTPGRGYYQYIAAQRASVLCDLDRVSLARDPGDDERGIDPLELYFSDAATMCVDNGMRRLRSILDM